MKENLLENLSESLDCLNKGILRSFKTMTDIDFTESSSQVVQTNQFRTKFETIASIPLSGSITGDIYICLNVSKWLPTFHAIAEKSGFVPTEEMIYSILGEIGNTAAGDVVTPLKDLFGPITILSPKVIIGKIYHPTTNIFNLDYKSEDGLEIEVRLSIDLMEQNLRAEHDKLLLSSKLDDTGLFNKKYFSKILSGLEESIEKGDGYFSIIFADINRLKYVNDNFGHDAGDEYIKTAANIVLKSCRSSDRCFRVGGDEIIMLLPNCPKEAADKVIQRMINFMDKLPISLKKNNGNLEEIKVHMSMGIASNSEGIRPKEVVKIADQRMESNKQIWYEKQKFKRRT